MKIPEHILKEQVLSTNDFKEPKEYIGKKAVALLVCRLILLEPGTDPIRPEMGIGLVSKYRYMYPEKLQELKKDIVKQIEIYLPNYSTVSIGMVMKNSQLVFDITVDDEVYKYITVEQEDNRVTLQELLENQ